MIAVHWLVFTVAIMFGATGAFLLMYGNGWNLMISTGVSILTFTFGLLLGVFIKAMEP